MIICPTLLACATLTERNPNALRMYDVDMSVTEIRIAAIHAIPIGHRAISPNGREILSKHFVVDARGGTRPAADAVQRYFAQILILGDRQPYDIEILVTREERVLVGENFTYKIMGYDARLAKDLEKRLRTELTKRREDRNIIDDFRVF
jgi:hypothetical protein